MMPAPYTYRSFPLRLPSPSALSLIKLIIPDFWDVRIIPNCYFLKVGDSPVGGRE